MNVNTDHVTECNFCYYNNRDPKKVITHMLNKHKGEASFTVSCVVPNCMYTTKTWLAYKQHFKRKHNFNLNSST